MAICHPCGEEFGSEQGVKAHMKKCALYQAHKRKKAAALGKLPKEAVTSAAAQPNPPVESPNFTASLQDLVKSMCEAMTKQDTPQTTQQQRRAIVQAAKTQVIDRYRPLSVTASMRGSAKLLIERELGTLPLEELPFEEVLEIAAATRDRLYEPTLRKQAREAERQQVANEARRRKQIEDLAAGHRADRRKTTFIEQAIGQARARCEAQQIVGWDRLGVLVDVEVRLKELLTGSESIPDAQVIIQTVLAARFVEAEAKKDAARLKADEQWREEVAAVLLLGAVVAAPLLAAQYPAQTLAVFDWIEGTFSYKPGAEAAAPTPEPSAQTPASSSPEARPRTTGRRKYPHTPSSSESPWVNSVGGEPGHA